jgi:hypothetical protein
MKSEGDMEIEKIITRQIKEKDVDVNSLKEEKTRKATSNAKEEVEVELLNSERRTSC